MGKDTTPGQPTSTEVKDAANATGEAADKVEGAATKVEDAAANADDDFTRKTLTEISAGLKGLTGTLEGLASDIRTLKAPKVEATPEPSSEHTEDTPEGSGETMGEPDAPASPAPPEKVKKGTYHKRKAKQNIRRGK